MRCARQVVVRSTTTIVWIGLRANSGNAHPVISYSQTRNRCCCRAARQAHAAKEQLSVNVPPLQPVCRAQPAAAVSHHEAVQVPSPMHAHRRVGAMLNASAVPQVVEQHHDQRVPPLGNVAMQAQAVKRLECAVQAARPAPAMLGPLLAPRLLLPLLLAV